MWPASRDKCASLIRLRFALEGRDDGRQEEDADRQPETIASPHTIQRGVRACSAFRGAEVAVAGTGSIVGLFF